MKVIAATALIVLMIAALEVQFRARVAHPMRHFLLATLALYLAIFALLLVVQA